MARIVCTSARCIRCELLLQMSIRSLFCQILQFS